MTSVLLFLISIMVMLSFLMLMQIHVINLIKLVIIQNIILTSYLVCKAWIYPSLELQLSLSITFIIKVILLPWALWKLAGYLKLKQHTESLINKPTLQFIGILLVIFTLILSHQIENTIGQQDIIGFSLSLANSMLAILLITSRRKAISQIIGLLVMENSIFLLSATLNIGFPWLVELGMGFDILIGFMIFGLFLLRIHTTHGSLHLKNLEKLKEKL
ncbi:MAG: hypothetical protein COX72_07360 [Gammaproteobacteria bacterium CG_4_10_14_0_2_um_filter_38_22]|nr:MAG: hypothetical protein COX72_07360 [Gammaproteobacteria bacterium CG_4_10_14_0_2_um_filter_38_22]